MCADDAANDDAGGRRTLKALRLRKLTVDCSTCYSQCQNIENMEENGYVDGVH